jgi:dipeptidyl aminopeptidase/acylaminoacyl peptidase
VKSRCIPLILAVNDKGKVLMGLVPHAPRIVTVCALVLSTLNAGLAEEFKRAIEPSDCVTVRRLLRDNSQRVPIQINPQGTRVAYLVRSPNLDTNEIDSQVYVKELNGNSSIPGTLALASDQLSSIQWMRDGSHLTLLGKDNNRMVVKVVDAETGKREVVAKSDGNIVEYSIDRNGDTIVFVTDATDQAVTIMPTKEENAKGFRISIDESTLAAFRHWDLFVSHKTASGWTTPEAIHLRSPFTKRPLSVLQGFANTLLSLSPDGRRLLVAFRDSEDDLPKEWRDDQSVKQMATSGFPGIPVMVLYNLDDGGETIPLDTPLPASIPLWSDDSKSYIVAAWSPVESSFEHDDFAQRRGGNDREHLFWVEPGTGKVELVASHLLSNTDAPLLWRGDTLLLRTAATTITALCRREGKWTEESHVSIPLKDLYRFASLASDGRYIVGGYENPTTPPELFLYRIGEREATIVAKLNEEFDHLTLAPVEEIHWQASPGYSVDGLLYMPPDYVAGKRYPLVVANHGNVRAFLCSIGAGAYPSYEPEPIANAGMLYLMRTWPEDFDEENEEAHYPKGYPGLQGYGGLQEAAFVMDQWDGAVKELDARGMIDSSKVGIVGFSRKGWYAEFILAHAKTHYSAASATDNVQYSLGEYWLTHNSASQAAYDAVYGGSPYGKSLENWKKYSVSFNLDKFHTPLLMEEMGNGIQYSQTAPQLSLAASYEVFMGLTRLHKPVELYYYPNEEHTFDHPQALQSNLQRNLDWFRFWLEGYERPNPEDPEQYARWTRLRSLQREDDGSSVPNSAGGAGRVHGSKPN